MVPLGRVIPFLIPFGRVPSGSAGSSGIIAVWGKLLKIRNLPVFTRDTQQVALRTQNPVELTLRVGSTPTSGTILFNNLRAPEGKSHFAR